MTTPAPTVGTPAQTYDAALAANPALTNDPSLAYPVVQSQVPAEAATQVVNAAQGGYYAQYLMNLPPAEQAEGFAGLNAQQQLLAQSQGYTSVLNQQNLAQVNDPATHAGSSFLSRVGGDITGAIGGAVGGVWNAGAKGLSLLNVPLHEAQRAVNAGILDVTDLAEGNGMSPLEAWNQAGNAPMTQDSLNDLTAKYGSTIMGMVRDAQDGKDPEIQQAAALKAGNSDLAASIDTLQNSPQFKQALIEANNHLISPGRVVASWVSNGLSAATGGHVDLYTHKALFGVLSGPVDAVFDFQADPLMAVTKLYELRNLAKYGVDVAKGFGGAAEEAAPALEAAVEGGAAGAAEGAGAGAEAGTVAGPEGAAAGGLGGAVVGGIAGAVAGGLKKAFGLMHAASTPIAANAIAKATTAGADGAAITDMAAWGRRMNQLFDTTTSAGQNVNRYFDGLGSEISKVVDVTPETAAEAGQAMQNIRRNYPALMPYLDAMTQWSKTDAAGNVVKGVRTAQDAHAFFNDTKGIQLLTTGMAASRTPLMAHRTQLAANIIKYMPRVSDIFDFMENGHKLTQDDYVDLKQNMADSAVAISPETRAAAADGLDLTNNTQASSAAAAAQQLEMAQQGWRGRTATVMRRLGSKIPEANEDGEFDLTSDNASQNFVRLARLFAPSYYADQMGAVFSAADVTGRKLLYQGIMRTMADSSGISKTAAGRESMERLVKAVGDSDVGTYSIGPVGYMTDGTPVAHDIRDATPTVPTLPAKEFYAQAAKHGVFAHTVGFTNKQVVDSMVDKIWRPFVLLRPAFAFRSSIEEAVNHVFRVGMTDKLKGMLSRSALNEIALRSKQAANGVSGKAVSAFNEFDTGLKAEHGLAEGTDVREALLKKANSLPQVEGTALRAKAQQWGAMQRDAQEKLSTAESMPDTWDPDHSRFMKAILSPITGSARMTTAVFRKLPLEMSIKGHGFTTTGAELRKAIDAHQTAGIQMRADLRDSAANLSNADEVFAQKYGRTVTGAKASGDAAATRQLAAHEDTVQALREDYLSKKAAVDNHGDLPDDVRAARDNMVQGYVDRGTANLVHFFGRVGLAYLQKAEPQELQWLNELAHSERGNEIVNHYITEMTQRTARNETIDYGQPGKRAPYKRIGMGPYAAQSSAGNLGSHAWSWSLDKLSQNPLARPALLNAKDPSAAIQGIKDVLAAHPEYRNTMKVLSVKSDDEFAAQMHQEVMHHLGMGGTDLTPGGLNEDLYDKMVTSHNGFKTLNPEAWHPQALNEYPDAARPNKVFGRDTMLVEDNSKEGFYTRAVQHGFERVGSYISYMSRQDQYLQEYVNMRKAMQPWEDMHNDHLLQTEADKLGVAKEDLDPATVAKMQGISRGMVIDHASEQSWYRTLKFLDHPGTRSQAAVLMRNMAPFWRAEQGFLERWGRSFRYSPSMIAKLDQAANYVPKNPLMHKDADGVSYMTIPGTGSLQRGMSVVGKALGVNMSYLPIPNTISGDLLQSSPGFNVDFLKHPLTGPMFTVPLEAVGALTHNSTLNTILSGASGSTAVGDESASGIILNSLPAVVRPMAQFLTDQNNVKEVAAQQAMAFLFATGHGIPPNATAAQRATFLKQVQASALGWTLVQALTKPFVPMPEHNEQPIPQADVAAQAAGLHTVKDEFNQLVKDTGSYEMAYQFWAEQHPDEIPFTTGSNQTTGGATIPETQEAFSWMENNQGLLNDYNLAASFLVPQNGTHFSYQPFALAQQLGMSQAKDNATYLANLEANSSLQTYYDAMDEKKAQLAGLGTSSAAAAAIRNQWAPWEDVFLATHPDVANYVADSGTRNANRLATITQMEQMLQDPRTPDSPEAQSMVNMLNLWNNYQVKLQGVVARGQVGTNQKAAYSAVFDAEAQQMAQSDPTSAMLYNKLFRDLETTENTVTPTNVGL